MATLKLSDLRTQLDEEFAPTVIELDDSTTVTLTNVRRLGTDARVKVLETLRGLAHVVDADDRENPDIRRQAESSLEGFRDLVLAAAVKNGPKLVAAVGDDVEIAGHVLREYLGGLAEPTDDRTGES